MGVIHRRDPKLGVATFGGATTICGRAMRLAAQEGGPLALMRPIEWKRVRLACRHGARWPDFGRDEVAEWGDGGNPALLGIGSDRGLSPHAPARAQTGFERLGGDYFSLRCAPATRRPARRVSSARALPPWSSPIRAPQRRCMCWLKNQVRSGRTQLLGLARERRNLDMTWPMILQPETGGAFSSIRARC